MFGPNILTSCLISVFVLLSPFVVRAQDGSGVSVGGTGTGKLPGGGGVTVTDLHDPWGIPDVYLTGLNSETSSGFFVGTANPGSIVLQNPPPPELEITATDLVELPGNLSFATGSTLSILENTSVPAVATLDIQGNLNLDDTVLNVIDGAQIKQSLAPGTVLEIIDYSGTESGNFVVDGKEILEGGSFQVGQNEFLLNYASGDPSVTLTVEAAPEPSTWAMMAAGVAMLIGLRRSRFCR